MNIQHQLLLAASMTQNAHQTHFSLHKTLLAIAISLSLQHGAQASIIAPAAVSVVTGQAKTIQIANEGEALTITRQPAHGTLSDNGDGSVSYTPNTDYQGEDGFSFSAELVGAPITGSGSVSINVILPAVGPVETGSNEDTIRQVIDKSQDPGLKEFSNNLAQLSDNQQALVIQSITPLQTAAQINSAAIQSGAQNRSVWQRLSEVHHNLGQGRSTGGIKVSANGRSVNGTNMLGGAAGDEEPSAVPGLLDERLGIYINGQFNKGNRINTGYEVGSSSDIFGVTLGMDYRLSDQLILGSAFGFSDNDTQYYRNAGQLLNRGYSGSIYGSYAMTDNWYVDSVFTYTKNDYESDRQLLIPDASGVLNTGRSKASPKGDQQRFSLGMGYDLPVGGWTFGIKGRGEYGRMNIDAYRENGSSVLNLLVDEQFNESALSVFGGQVSYAYSTPFGVLVPHVNLDWEHEFKNNSRNMVMRFANDLTQSFVIKTNNPDRDYLMLRAGMSATFANGLSSFMQYETLLDQRYETAHSARLGVRWDF